MAFRIAGVVILLLFYGCYIGKMALQGRAGIRTDQMGRGKSGAGKRLEQTVKAAAYGRFWRRLSASWWIRACFHRPSGPLEWPRGLCWNGRVHSLRGGHGEQLEGGRSRGEETELVPWGVYRLSRNPAFLGFDLLYAGMAAMFFNWVLLAVSLFGVFMFHCQIVHMEEPFLTEAFGEAYREYRREVRRYFGRGRRAPPKR